MFVMKNNNEYLGDIMKKLLNSYSIIENLSDSPHDLELLEIELKKINGFLLVLSKKIVLLNNLSDSKKLEKKINRFILTIFFKGSRRIDLNCTHLQVVPYEIAPTNHISK